LALGVGSPTSWLALGWRKTGRGGSFGYFDIHIIASSYENATSV
jgi:hypothetical protein